MPVVDFYSYYFTGKHNNGARTHISKLNLPASMSDEDIATLVASFELLSNNSVTNSATHPRLTIFSVTESVFHVSAAQNVIEPYEGTANPLGFKGYFISTDESLPLGGTLATPFEIENVRSDFEVPTGYTTTADPYNIVEQLCKDLYSIQDVDDEGSLQALPVDIVEFTRRFKNH